MVPPRADERQMSLIEILHMIRNRKEQQPQYVPQAALRSTNFCHQLLATELGWPTSPSLNTWRAAQARQHTVQLQLPAVYHNPPIISGQRQQVSVLEVQQQGTSTNANHMLAAVGYNSGMMHIIRVGDLLQTASRAQTTQYEAAANSSIQVPASTAAVAAVPPSSVMMVDLQDRLLSCCWAPSGGQHTEMVTAGSQGVKIRRFVEGRHHEYPLKVKSGSQLAKPLSVKYLDRTSAYQVVAAKAGGLVLWDCRTASRAVVEVATDITAQLLQPMPGGTVLLTATADGQMSLYDVRRISGNSSSVVNFGGRKTCQQLIASFDISARADEAAAAGAGAGSQPDFLTPGATGSSSSSVGRRVHPCFRDVKLNPVDCNMVAYVKTDLQVGVFDLYSNKVLQQLCVTEVSGAAVPAAATAAVQVSGPRQAPARCCWDSQGRILYTHGLLAQYSNNTMGAGVMQLQPTVAAVDFGCWHGKQHRRESNCGWATQHSGPENIVELSQGAVLQAVPEAREQQDLVLDADTSDNTGRGQLNGCGSMSGGAVMCQSGQVLHVPLGQAGPSEMAVCAQNGELLLGTLSGDLMCVM